MTSLNNRMSTEDIFKIVRNINVNSPKFITWLFAYNNCNRYTVMPSSSCVRANCTCDKGKLYHELTTEQKVELHDKYASYLSYKYIASYSLLRLVSWYKRRKLGKVTTLIRKLISRDVSSIISQYL